MTRFETTLARGGKPPYDTWTFAVVPPEVCEPWGAGPTPVRGTIAGTPFRGTASRGEGVVRVPLSHAFRQEAGVAVGDRVVIELEPDPEPRPVEIPDELRAVLDADRDLAARFDALPPAHRRAWATHVAEAKRPETRARRAAKAPDGIRAREFPR
jgi:hypothetical protein